MAQLSNDCFAFGDKPLTLEEAHQFIAARVSPVGEVEHMPLLACDGRVLAADIRAQSPLPAFFNAAVDGYAVQHGQLSTSGPTHLPIVGRLQAGAPSLTALQAGTAMRIFTGAPMPPGADTVFMQEDVIVEVGVAHLPAGLKCGANARPAGEELAAGALALHAGTRLLPQHLALAAGIGFAMLPVRRCVRAAIFSTGDELREPGNALAGAAVYDTNRVMLAALLARLGVAVTDLGVLSDDILVVRRALREAAASHDLIITSGGVSTGEADFIKSAVEAEGRLDHWRFAIKPGRPLAMGVIGGAAFAGLPGNPVAVFVTFTQVVRALIAALGGEAWQAPRWLPVCAGFTYAKKIGRVEFVRVSLEYDTGSSVARRYPIEGAGIISSLTHTDGLVRLPLDMTQVSLGDALDYAPFSALLG